MKTVLLSLLVSGAVLAGTSAVALDQPTGRVILTIKGQVDNTNADGAAKFDLKMLEALTGRKGTMETPWTEGQVTFTGPYLRSVLKAAGAHGGKLIVKALNDYSAEVPSSDADMEVILATRMNGEEMPVRDKGPLFLIYPFDLDASFFSEKYFARSVWQIKEIEVTD